MTTPSKTALSLTLALGLALLAGCSSPERVTRTTTTERTTTSNVPADSSTTTTTTQQTRP
jgi:uncharacterized lipoprotein YajG